MGGRQPAVPLIGPTRPQGHHSKDCCSDVSLGVDTAECGAAARVSGYDCVMADAMKMPAAFVGHGSPMNALETNDYTAAWQSFGAALPRPRAIVCVSAHWYINATAVTAMSTPRTIHDFYGFPDELFAVEYPAPGAPDIAEEIAEVVKPTWVGLDADSWGIDHGTWSVLVHMFPAADVPVIQLAINATKPFEYHLELGAQLAALRARGVFIVGSGNVVHNLRRIEWREPTKGFDWAQRFDAAACELLAQDPSRAPALRDHPDYTLAAPTPDHFIPLLYLAGVSAASNEMASPFVQGCAMGSLSMTSYVGGDVSVNEPPGPHEAASVPRDVATDETNL